MTASARGQAPLRHTECVYHIYTLHYFLCSPYYARALHVPMACKYSVYQIKILYDVMQSHSTAFLCGRRLGCAFNMHTVNALDSTKTVD